MSNEQFEWPRRLHIAHCSLLILAQDSTPAGSWSQCAVNKPWRLPMNQERGQPCPCGHGCPRSGSWSQRVTKGHRGFPKASLPAAEPRGRSLVFGEAESKPLAAEQRQKVAHGASRGAGVEGQEPRSGERNASLVSVA